jgi:hypothetical protein
MAVRTRIIYDSKQLIPAPFCSINSSTDFAEDGTFLGRTFQITLQGTIVAFKGSPNSSGELWDQSDYPPDEVVPPESRLKSILRKQEAIRKLFSIGGKQLEIQSGDASQPLKCNPRVTGITFSEDIWYDKCSYQISFETDVLSINGELFGEDELDAYIKTVNESWEIGTNEEPEALGLPRTYTLTHSVSATGKTVFDEIGQLTKPAWQQARDWVLPKLGFDSAFTFSSGMLDLPSYYNTTNHIRSENIDIYGGQYSVTENWTLCSGLATDTFDVQTSVDSQVGTTKVSINGEIRGYEARNANMQVLSTKYQNALDKFNTVSGLLISRAQTYSNTTLNVVPLSFSVSRNPLTGVISYNSDYDTRPSNEIPGALAESISINDTLGTDYPAIIFVLARPRGPIIQNLMTSKERRRTLNLEAIFNVSTLTGTLSEKINNNPRVTIPEITQVIQAATPFGSTVLVEDQTENWDIKTGQYSYNITWVWE